MNKTRISKAYRGNRHIGFKKTIGGREWFLVYGTTPVDEAQAIAIATALEAKWQLIRLSGGTELSDTEFAEAKELASGRSRETPGPTKPPPHAVNPSSSAAIVHRWLHASIDEFASVTLRSLKPDASNGDHVFNTCDRIRRAREAQADIRLDLLRRKELDEWLLGIMNLASKKNGKPLKPVSIRNLARAVRTCLTKFVEWEWWAPPALWERAFKPYTVKKLQTPRERKESKKRSPAHSVNEKRVLWHLSLPFTKAMMALADWAGHTQKEVSTLMFDEIKDDGIDMFVERDRNKTGVPGRWWMPPEAAAVIRRVVARTTRDPVINPDGLAFLTPCNQPLVHRSGKSKRARSDYIGRSLWPSLLGAARHYGVRHISYKFMRKGTSQLIRDDWSEEVSRTFLAQTCEDVQDEHYNRASLAKVERAIRQLYPTMKRMFEPIGVTEWEGLKREILREQGRSEQDEPSIAA